MIPPTRIRGVSQTLSNVSSMLSRSPTFSTLSHEGAPSFSKTRESRHVWLGDLSDTASVQDLLAIATPFGPVEEANILVGRHTGLVRFASDQDAQRFVNSMRQMGNIATFANVPNGPRPERIIDPEGTNLYCSGLPLHWNEDDLKENLFPPPYTVKSARILRLSDRTSRGIGFVRLTSREHTLESIERLNGSHLAGSNEILQVRVADLNGLKMKEYNEGQHRKAQIMMAISTEPHFSSFFEDPLLSPVLPSPQRSTFESYHYEPTISSAFSAVPIPSSEEANSITFRTVTSLPRVLPKEHFSLNQHSDFVPPPPFKPIIPQAPKSIAHKSSTGSFNKTPGYGSSFKSHSPPSSPTYDMLEQISDASSNSDGHCPFSPTTSFLTPSQPFTMAITPSKAPHNAPHYLLSRPTPAPLLLHHSNHTACTEPPSELPSHSDTSIEDFMVPISRCSSRESFRSPYERRGYGPTEIFQLSLSRSTGRRVLSSPACVPRHHHVEEENELEKSLKATAKWALEQSLGHRAA